MVIPELEKKCIQNEEQGLSTIAIKRQIQKLKDEKKNYLLKNSKHIFDYFENKKEVSLDNNKTKILNSFFSKLVSAPRYISISFSKSIKHYAFQNFLHIFIKNMLFHKNTHTFC